MQSRLLPRPMVSLSNYLPNIGRVRLPNIHKTAHMNKWKWGVIIGLLIAVFLLGRCNGRDSVLRNTKTTVRKDSVVINYIPIPYKVQKDSIVYKTRTAKPLHDTLEVPGETIYLPAETPDWAINMLNDWNTTRYYDTSIINRGDTVGIQDKVYKNRIVSRNIRAVFTDSTKTIVLKPPRRTVGYFTLSGLANSDKDAGIAVGFALKNKNDRTYLIEYQKTFGIKQPFIKGTIAFPIRLFPNLKK